MFFQNFNRVDSVLLVSAQSPLHINNTSASNVHCPYYGWLRTDLFSVIEMIISFVLTTNILHTMSVMISRACTSTVIKAVMLFLWSFCSFDRVRAASAFNRSKLSFSNFFSPSTGSSSVSPLSIAVTSEHHIVCDMVSTTYRKRYSEDKIMQILTF